VPQGDIALRILQVFVQARGLIELFARRMISRTKCIKAVPEHRAQVNKASSSRVSFQELEAGRMFSPSRNSILLPRV
jgi:hypothetical protein